MNRIAACIEYCGFHYNGWQRQPHAPSVQHAVESAISKVANELISVVVAGRTDTGVHGIGQIIHFDTNSERSTEQWVRGTNTYLPKDIALMWVHPVNRIFHARYQAVSRCYRYVILNRKVNPSYLYGRVTWHRPHLDIESMQTAAKALVGKHNFNAFRAIACQSKDPIKTINHLQLDQSGPWIWLDISADGFLHHMIRNIAGVLTRIGEGRELVDWAGAVLASRNRNHAGITAAPDGLYFVSATYPSEFGMPDPPEVCRFW